MPNLNKLHTNKKENIMSKEQLILEKYKALHIGGVIASAVFVKDMEKAIEEGNEVGYNEDGGYNYYCEGTALNKVMKVIKKHLL